MPKVIKDIVAVVVSRFSSQVVSLVLTPLAARTMPQDEFGAWVLILTVTAFSSVLADAGLSNYVIKELDWSPLRRATVFWSSIAIGTTCCICLLALSGALCRALGVDEWTLAMQLVSLSFVPASGGAILTAELRKQRRFAQITLIDGTSSLMLLIIAGTALTLHLGLYSYVIATVLVACVPVIWGSMLVGVPNRRMSRAMIREAWAFTGGLLGFNVVNYWARKLDHLLVGTIVGTSTLAYYSVAYRLMLLPITQINRLVLNLLFPYISPHQKDLSHVRQSLLQGTQVIGLIIFPPMTFLWLAREEIIRWYLGPGWDGVSNILKVYAPLGMLQALVNPIGLAYQLTGSTTTQFKLGIANTLLTACGVAAGAYWGIRGVVVGYAAANLVMLYPNVERAYRTTGGSFICWLKSVWPLWLIPVIAWIINRGLDVGDGSVVLTALVVLFTSLCVLFSFFARLFLSVLSYLKNDSA